VDVGVGSVVLVRLGRVGSLRGVMGDVRAHVAARSAVWGLRLSQCVDQTASASTANEAPFFAHVHAAPRVQSSRHATRRRG